MRSSSEFFSDSSDFYNYNHRFCQARWPHTTSQPHVSRSARYTFLTILTMHTAIIKNWNGRMFWLFASFPPFLASDSFLLSLTKVSFFLILLLVLHRKEAHVPKI